MNTDPNLKPDSFPRWVLIPCKEMPKDWLELPKRTITTGEPERLITQRLCTKCKNEKPFSEFSMLKSGAHDSWCKTCRNFARKERRNRSRNSL